MSDLYSELLVKKEVTAKDNFVKFGSIGLVVLLALAGILIYPVFLLAAVIAGVLAYFFALPSTNLEYEYLFVNGEIDVDKVIAKSKRKKMKTINITEADIVAPLDSHRIDYYNNNQRLKVVDYSSGNPQHKRFAVIMKDGTELCKFIIEPDENMAKSIKNSAPSKVFLD